VAGERSARVARVASAVGAAAGALGLLGWQLDITALRSVGGDWRAMRPVTALALLLLGSSLWPARASAASHRGLSALQQAAALAAALLGLVTLIEYAAGVNVGIGDLLLRGPFHAPETPFSGRMAPASAVSAALIGAAVVALHRKARSARVLAEALGIVVGGIAAVMLVGVLYGTRPGETGSALPHMAVNTALGLLALSVATVSACPESLLLQVLRGDPPGGTIARRVLPVLLVALLLVGLASSWVERAGRFGEGFADAVQVVASMALVGVVLLWGASGLNRAEAKRRQSEDRYRHVLDGMLEGCQIIDRDWRYLYLNDAAAAHGRRAKADMLGHTMTEMYPGIEATALFASLRECMERRVPGRRDNEFAYPDGSTAWFDLSIEPVPEGVFVLSLDVTERRRHREAVERLNADLERRVQERTTELAASNNELQAFAYSVSHDLRAPLRSINGFSQALAEDAGDRLDQASREHLSRIQAATQRMGQLIDDLLKLSRVTRTEMRREAVDLSALAAEVTAELRRRHPERRVETVIAPGLLARGDRSLLGLVLENLLGNAWKFSAARECARIEVGGATVDGSPAFFVRDDGAGFDMAYADKLFTPFQRLHSTAQFEGTGIGLATVRRIVQRHGGKVWAQGEVGRGATFTFTLDQAGP
jgi:PAS domain S-box-containing protein